jgi:hypothetical protein
MSTRDPLSLQNLLFTSVRALGGTWKPAPAAIGDVAISATESQLLGDGSVMRLLIVIAAVGTDTDKPVMHLTHFVSVTDPSYSGAVGPTMSCSAVTPCAFLTVDDVIEAFDVATVAVNARVAVLIEAAEVSRGI